MGISIVNRVFFILAITLCSLALVGQDTVNQTAWRTNPGAITNAQMSVYGINPFSTRVFATEGTPYLDDMWFTGDVKLYDGKLLDDIPFMYDIANETLVINLEGEYYTLPNSVFTQFSAMQITDKGFRNIRNFIRIANPDNTSNYYEIIQSNGTISLALDHEAKFIKANYNTALDVGSPNDKYVKDQEHVMIINGQLIKLKGSNKKILSQIEDQNLRSFIKENKINLKDNEQIVDMMKNYKI